MTWPRSLSPLLVLLLASAAWAQDVASGPEEGGKVPALKVFDATGAHEGKEVDYAAERKDKPTVYVFVQVYKWDRRMARFLRGLDEAVHKEEVVASVVGVW